MAPIPPGLVAFQHQLATARHHPDDAIADLLTTGYAHVLDLEAEQLETGRRIDDLLQAGDDDAALEAARHQRGLRAMAIALREELDSLGAMRRPRRAAGPPPPGRGPEAS
jgi:hypothetical protein